MSPSIQRFAISWPLALLAAALLLFAPLSVARASAVITVTTPLPGIANDGQCSLIEAIVNANDDALTHDDCVAGFGADVIELGAGTIYTLTSVHNTVGGENGLPSITSNITINGHGATIARSEAGSTPSFRVFHVAATGVLTLNEVTIRNGAADSDGTGNGGGALFNAGTLTLNNCTVTENSTGTRGGGIANLGGNVTIGASVISLNSAVAAGAGISNRDGFLTVQNSTISANTSTTTADEGAGGGIASHAYNADATLILTDSIVSANTTNGLGGGGIDNSARTGHTATATVTRSTISDNVANGVDHTNGLGGGIQNSFIRPVSNATARLTVNNST
ncbi:MAG: hypothetical protein ACRDIB_03260, partial [Ardenticatenaceae bacterium]